MSDVADTRDQEPTGRRRFPWRWMIAAAVLLLITIVAIPLKVANDCQQVLNAAEAAGGELDVNVISYEFPYVGPWPSRVKYNVKKILPPGIKCLDPWQIQVFSFDESAAIDNNWLLEQNFSALPCVVQIRIRNRQVSDVGLRSLGTLGNLQSLGVARTSLTDEGFKAFSGHRQLMSLSLHETQVTAASLPVLTSMPNLTELVVSCTDIAGDDLRLLRSCPNLSSLSVDAGQLTEPFLSSLSTFPKLTQLFVLSPTPIPDTGLSEEAVESGAGVVVDDAILQRLLKETTLIILWIDDGSAITDASVPALLKSAHLRALDAWDVGMSAEGARKVNSVHRSRWGRTKPAIRLAGESTIDRDDFAQRYKYK